MIPIKPALALKPITVIPPGPLPVGNDTGTLITPKAPQGVQKVGAGVPAGQFLPAAQPLGPTNRPFTVDSGPDVATPLYYSEDFDFTNVTEITREVGGRSLWFSCISTTIAGNLIRVFLDDNPTGMALAVFQGRNIAINNFPFRKVRITSVAACVIAVVMFNTNAEVSVGS